MERTDAVREIARAVLSLDGDCGCALLGVNLQEGEAEFVKVDYSTSMPDWRAERAAAFRALIKLRERLGIEITYAIGQGLS